MASIEAIMASGDLLKQLFQSYRRRKDDEFQSAALRIIAEERQKKHHTLATQLEGILLNGSPSPSLNGTTNDDLPKDRERNSVLLEVRAPKRYLAEMVLSEENAAKITSLILEYNRGDVLRSHGMTSRTKLLFCGPPGCGKSMCAEVIASELALPMLYTRFDSVISSYLGETASNIRKVFDYTARGTWVLFFDEFDAIGKSREDISEHGELKRVVNSFLQILDAFRSESLVVAATNHEGLLDRALWRRFDEIVYFDLPTIGQITQLLQRKLGNFPHAKINYSLLARQLKGFSHAAVERVCLNAIRTCIVGNLPEVTLDQLQRAAFAERKRMALAAGKRGSGSRRRSP